MKSMEDELAESIAAIIDEETSEAKNMYGDKANDTIDVPDVTRKNTEPESGKNGKKPMSQKTKMVISIGSIVAAIIIIVVVAVVFINSSIKKSKDNYGYYQNLAYEAKDNSDFEKAISYFEKAMKHKDTFLEDETVTVDGVKVSTEEILVKDMLNLRDCYDATGDTEAEADILKEILQYDSLNQNAVYYLVNLYAEEENYTDMYEVYTELKAISGSSDVLKYFSKYECSVPVISPEGGEYGKNQDISFDEEKNCKIYYTIDGSDPLEEGTLYTDEFELKEGTTTVKYYMVNEYGFKSDVLEAEYVISHAAPEKAKISPTSGSYSTSSEQMITISNVPEDCTAYYEISFDGEAVKPTKNSTVYEEPFEMPEGSFFISVIVIDEEGTESEIATNNYTLKKVDKYDDASAEQLIWSTLAYNGIIDSNRNTSDGKSFELKFNTKNKINDMNLWLFSVKIDGESKDYWYGCDSSTGKIYKVEKVSDSDEYTTTELKYGT